jgi:hypothetical protein
VNDILEREKNTPVCSFELSDDPFFGLATITLRSGDAVRHDGWLLWRCKLTRPAWRRPRREMRDMIGIEFESNQRDADADPTSGGLL